MINIFKIETDFFFKLSESPLYIQICLGIRLSRYKALYAAQISCLSKVKPSYFELYYSKKYEKSLPLDGFTNRFKFLLPCP